MACLCLCLAGFLLFLWFADPWPPQLSPHSDLIALRFLLFLGHTYAAALLLTTPLVAAETALRKVWAYEGGGGACLSTDGMGCQVLECSEALEKGDAHPLGADADRGRDKWKQLSHAIGSLCCLAVWTVSGLRAGWSVRSLEELWVAECLHTRASLSACLPRMLPSTVEPFWGAAILSLLLLLFLAMDLAARVRQDKHNMGDGDNNNNNINNNNNKSSSWQHLVPGLVRPSSLTTEPWLLVEPEPRSVDPEKTSSSCTAPTAGRRPSEHKVAHRPAPALHDPETTLGDPRRGPDRTVTERGPGPQRVVPSLGLIATTGLVGMLSLCTLPLVLSVNVLLVQTMNAVVEGCVDTCVAQWRQAEARSTVLRTL